MQESTGSSKSKQMEATEAKTSAKVVRSGKRLRGDPQPEDVVQISDEEEEETAIDELASKKMRLEVEVKKAELKSLRSQKQAAVDKVKEISSELEAVHKLIGEEKECLKQHKEEEKSYKKQAETYDIEIQALQRKRDDVLKLKAEKRRSVKGCHLNISIRELEETSLKGKLDKANLNVKKFDQEIADLPAAPGYSQDMLSLLDSQIAGKKRELECPVCFEESAPPIYTCTAQHLVCANCR